MGTQEKPKCILHSFRAQNEIKIVSLKRLIKTSERSMKRIAPGNGTGSSKNRFPTMFQEPVDPTVKTELPDKGGVQTQHMDCNFSKIRLDGKDIKLFKMYKDTTVSVDELGFKAMYTIQQSLDKCEDGSKNVLILGHVTEFQPRSV